MDSVPTSDFRLLEADIRRQPDLLAAQLPYLRRAAEQACADLSGEAPPRIYLVANGDGLSANLSVRYTWEGLLGCPVEAVPAMTFSRYAVETAAPGSLVILISQSGQVVRVIEALAAALRHHLPVLVFTNRPDSPLAQMAGDRVLDLGFTRLGFTPGASAFTYTLAALYEFAAAYSQNSLAAQNLDAQISGLPQSLAQAIGNAWQPIREFAPLIEKKQVVYTLGSGPVYGTAHYTQRKLFEICQANAILLETEEYAHDAFYAMGPDTPAVLFAPPDAGFRRCAEVAGYLAGTGSRVLVVSGPEHQSVFNAADVIFTGLASTSTVETTLTYAIAGQILTCLAGPRLGGSFYACANPLRYHRGDAQIYNSARMDLIDG